MPVTTAVKERPILFSGAMVRAILDGRKTQTRRVVKPQPELSATGGFVRVEKNGKRWLTGLGSDFGGTCRNFVASASPFKVGAILWVRESLHAVNDTKIDDAEKMPIAAYSADGSHIWTKGKFRKPWEWQRKNLPSIHMPRKLSRITLEITDVRVQRLTEISEEDAIAEGVARDVRTRNAVDNEPQFRDYTRPDGCTVCSAVDSFASLWKSINGKDSWEANPWVWAITFKRII